MAATFLPAPAFSLDDPQRLAKTDLTKCILLMNTGPAQLSYSVFDPRDQCFIALKSYYFESGNHDTSPLQRLEKCFARDKMLFTGFSEIRISFDNPDFTLVPSALFDPVLRREYLSFLTPELPSRALLYDQIFPLKAVNVYAVNKDVAGYLKKEFSTARYYHADTAFVVSLMKNAGLTGDRMYVRVLPGRMTVVVMREDGLQMVQPYTIHHEIDALYYVLNAIRQLGLTREGLQVFLSGEIGEDSRIYKELHGEIPQVSWLRHPSVFKYIEMFGEYPDHHFYNLISLASCE